jgi:hypothetical protein
VEFEELFLNNQNPCPTALTGIVLISGVKAVKGAQGQMVKTKGENILSTPLCKVDGVVLTSDSVTGVSCILYYYYVHVS